MEYISTRNSSKTFNFKEVFIKGLADDGGLFIPKSLNKFNEAEIDSFKKFGYQELAKKIIFSFIGDFMSENDLSKIIDKSYSVFREKNVVGFDIVELCPNPTDGSSNFLAAKLYYKMLSYKFLDQQDNEVIEDSDDNLSFEALKSKFSSDD